MELKARTGLAKKTIERARGPLIEECRLSTLCAIAKILDVAVQDLFEND